jgi:Protein of unknown function (DUF3305)
MGTCGALKTLRAYSGLRLVSLSGNNLRSIQKDNIEAMSNPLRRPAAVVTAKRIVDNPWTSEIWVPVAVIEREGAREDAPILLERNAAGEQWLHLGFEVELNRTEAEGYYLNLTTDQPVAFVEWELTESGAEPRWVTLSYHEAARRLDGGAQVEAVPIPSEWLPWLAAFTQQHLQIPEKKRRPAPASFLGAKRDIQ